MTPKPKDMVASEKRRVSVISGGSARSQSTTRRLSSLIAKLPLIGSSRPTLIESSESNVIKSGASNPKQSIRSNLRKTKVTESRLLTTIPEPQNVPFLALPIELIQQIAWHLDSDTITSLSLCSRSCYYVLGSDHLSTYIERIHITLRRQKIERRKRLEILECAFPSKWYCAWCDEFHAADLQGGPKSVSKEEDRPCAKYNSYLHDKEPHCTEGEAYHIYFHHIRLACNAHLRGPEYGIPVSTFSYDVHRKRKVSGFTFDTHLQISARIINTRFYLYSSYTLRLPGAYTNTKSHPDDQAPENWRKYRTRLAEPLESILPHIVVGHRHHMGYHTSRHESLTDQLEAAVQQSALEGSIWQCSNCDTDWRITSSDITDKTGSLLTRAVRIEAWRDLGTGRSPFDSTWRAHGVSSEEERKRSRRARSMEGKGRVGQELLEKIFNSEVESGDSSGRTETEIQDLKAKSWARDKIEKEDYERVCKILGEEEEYQFNQPGYGRVMWKEYERFWERMGKT